MRSIAKVKNERKGVRIVKGGLGYMVIGQTNSKGGNHPPPPKREEGDITGFSAASQRRLRATLAMARPAHEGSAIFGLTLTIPGEIVAPDVVRDIWHSFHKELMRQYPDVGAVWRIELQTRKQAHWHTLMWIPPSEKFSPFVRAVMIAEMYRKVVRARVGALSKKTDRGFDRRGVDIKTLTTSTPSGIIQYLCDHTSKRKQAQLGWQGRQWGVVGRENLLFIGTELATVDTHTHKKAARQFRRLQDHLRKDGRYTGASVTPSGNVSKAVFGRDAERLLACYRANKPARERWCTTHSACDPSKCPSAASCLAELRNRYGKGFEPSKDWGRS